MSESIFEEKKKTYKMIHEHFKFEFKFKPIGLIILHDETLLEDLLGGLKVLGANFVIETTQTLPKGENYIVSLNVKKDFYPGFDFILTDNDTQGLKDFFTRGVVPLLPVNHYFGSVLKDFNPLSNEGNGFFYKEANVWCVFESLVRFMENYKFPYDHRNLIKNVLSL